MSDYFEVKRNPNLIEIPEGATNGEVINLVFPNEVWGREFNEKWMKAHYRK